VAAIADGAGRQYATWDQAAFWVATGILIVPTATYLVAANPTRTQRLIAVTAFGLTLYLAKVVLAPAGFKFHDEFAHWRTAGDLVATHGLFAANPLIPVSALYPGLELATTAISQVSGLSIFVSAVVLVGVARLVLLLALFLFIERASASARLAALAVLVYAGNPNFLFFDSQYSYESLALPLGMLLLYLAVRRRAEGATAATVGAALVAAALAVTHHMTSWLVGAAITAMALVVAGYRLRHPGDPPIMAGRVAALSIAGPLLWFAVVGTQAIGYVTPHVAGGGRELLNIIAGNSHPRTLFVGVGQVSPLWERALGFGAVVILLVGVAVGTVQLWRRRSTVGALMLFLGLVACLYPGSLALRLTTLGSESSNRTSEFVYVSLGALTAFVALAALDRWPRSRLLPVLLVAGVVVIIGGGIVVGWARWARLPGPYIVSGDPNSIEPQGLTSAHWSLRHLGPGNRIAADRINGILMGSPLGQQTLISGLSAHVGTQPLLLGARFDDAARQVVRRGTIRYVVADRRLSEALPFTGIYVEKGEKPWRHPLTPRAAAKFDHLFGSDRVYDSGAIQIFRLGGRRP
jgi:hypothetical protein